MSAGYATNGSTAPPVAPSQQNGNGAGYKVALATQGTRGDFQPILCLALCFREHGHTVRIFANPDHCRMAEEYGLDAVVSCMEVKDVLKTEGGMRSMETGDLLAAIGSYSEDEESAEANNRNFVEGLHEFQPDVCIFTGLISDKVLLYLSIFPINTIPFIAASYQPQVYPSEEFGPIMMFRVQLEEGQPMVHKWIMMYQYQGKNQHELVQAARAGGAPEEIVNLMPGVEGAYIENFEAEYEAEPKILAYSEAFWPAPADWPKESGYLKILGQWRFSKEEQEEQTKKGSSLFSVGPEFDVCREFIKAGPTPVYIGWGSMTVYSREHMARLAVESLKKSGQRGIIVGGWAGMDSECLNGAPDEAALKVFCKENVLFMQAAPHEWLFPQMSVCVHHGGIGTAQASLGGGTPTIVTPVFADQHDIAHHVEKEGWGLGTCQLAQLTSDELGEKIKLCVASAGMKAKCMALAEKIAKEDGCAATVEMVTKWLRETVATGDWAKKRQAKYGRIREYREKFGKKSIEQIFAFFNSRICEKFPQMNQYNEAQMDLFTKMIALAAQKKLWVVAVGTGLLARAGEKLKSDEVGRFTEFAILQELELKGSRLRAKLLKGVGPKEGWVSLQVKEREVVKMVPQDPREIGIILASQMAKQFADIQGLSVLPNGNAKEVANGVAPPPGTK